ncbi:MAG: J domain-containing protein [Clostridiaceae bacterium]|jgi:curved DNA-binding protein CbpA|nr:J domain-containing protein [Clostridiaceae bacterium]
MAKSPYDVLGVRPGATADEIKQSYRKLVKKYHPDNYKNHPLEDLAKEKMQEVNEAYDQLTNTNRQQSAWQNRDSGPGAPNTTQQQQQQWQTWQQRQWQQQQQQQRQGPYYREGGLCGTDLCNTLGCLCCTDSCCECMGGDLCGCC